ncbi:MAG: HepT-like ribonuclease domain-containing protein [Rhodospirillaceae bacterium]|nr:HepT-like ribonuclease domain-containing protein [Rhodospirillaceae bacterium]
MPSPYSKSAHLALTEIAENITLARNFIGATDADAFARDMRTVYAVTRCLEIISEAVRRLPADVVSRHPHVPWDKIRAAGNIYRHEYDNVSPRILWTTVKTALDDLERAVGVELDTAERPQ